jgi:hypothetical protein
MAQCASFRPNAYITNAASHINASRSNGKQIAWDTLGAITEVQPTISEPSGEAVM